MLPLLVAVAAAAVILVYQATRVRFASTIVTFAIRAVMVAAGAYLILAAVVIFSDPLGLG